MELLITPDRDALLEREAARVPEHCRRGLLDYFRYGLCPGHFLMAVLENNLTEACGRADDENRRALFDYIYVLYNAAPSVAWGTPEKVAVWLRIGAEMRQRQAQGVE